MTSQPPALGVYTVHCFWLSCGYTTTGTTPDEAHTTMEVHYSEKHWADLDRITRKGVS